MQERSRAARERILETAARLFQRQGYHATGLNQIIQESGSPKGSLYHYFPNGKDELAVEAILWTKRTIGEKIQAFLAQRDDPVDAIQALIRATAQSVRDIESIIPCTVSLLSLEMSLLSEPIRAACESTMDAWAALFSEKLRGICDDNKAQDLGLLIQTLIDGALIRSLNKKDIQPLLQVADRIPFLIGLPDREDTCEPSHAAD